MQKRGREARETGDICVPMADERRCVAETNTILKSNYASIKEKNSIKKLKNKMLFKKTRKKINETRLWMELACLATSFN